MTSLGVKSGKLQGRAFSWALLAFLCCISVLVFLPHNARATTVSDNFNRANSDLSDGPNWETSNAANGCSIYSNAVGESVAPGWHENDWIANTFQNDQF